MAKFTKLSFCQNLFCAKFDEFPSLPVLKILNNQSVTAFSFFSLNQSDFGARICVLITRIPKI